MLSDGHGVAGRKFARGHFANDHLPAHVHVFGDGEAKIDLAGKDGLPVLIWADGMNRGDVRRALRLVTAQRLFLLKRWKDSHG